MEVELSVSGPTWPFIKVGDEYKKRGKDYLLSEHTKKKKTTTIILRVWTEMISMQGSR